MFLPNCLLSKFCCIECIDEREINLNLILIEWVEQWTERILDIFHSLLILFSITYLHLFVTKIISLRFPLLKCKFWRGNCNTNLKLNYNPFFIISQLFRNRFHQLISLVFLQPLSYDSCKCFLITDIVHGCSSI